LAGARWKGNGIASSTAAADPALHAIGVIANDARPLGLPGALRTTFAGETVGIDDVLVKYTYFGDADLDGAVTSNDYFQIDNGFLGNKTGWINGDFDYNGVINTNDYFLIDSAFLAQGGTILSPAGASLPAGVTAVPEPASLGVV